MTTPNSNPIDRLATLAAQRTARTDRLHEATCALLSQLEDHVNLNTCVSVDGYSLSLRRLRSNVGYANLWAFEAPDFENCTDLESPVCFEGYLHGDFSARRTGPTRSLLVDFAKRAPQFVAALIARAEADVAALETAQAATDAAIEAVQS